MNEGKYETAMIALAKMDGYKDSNALIETCDAALKEDAYNYALTLMDSGDYSGDYDKAIEIFTELGDYKDSARLLEICLKNNVKVGDIITMGSYEQDDDISNGKEEIEWIVLEREQNKALVISKYGLDAKLLDENISFESYFDLRWETCTLRSWLNEDFYDEAFDAEEKMKIQLSTVITAEEKPASIRYETIDNETHERLFLLSSDEVESYVESGTIEDKCIATEYAVSHGAIVHYDESVSWWIRNIGMFAYYHEDSYQGVLLFGDISYKAFYDEDLRCYYAVRPAMWIDIS